MVKFVLVLASIWGCGLAIPVPGHGSLTGYCMTGSDCQPDECCVSLNQPRGRKRRQLLDSSLLSHVNGKCQKMGTTNSRCLAQPHLHAAPTGVYYSCPCANHYTCKGMGVYEVPLGEIGMCESTIKNITIATLGRSCTSGADCASSECCVNDFRPIGRRRRSDTHGHSHCKAMGHVGSNCFVRMHSGKPNTTTFACPCTAGLTCHGSGQFDIPLGETGRCG